MMNYITGLGVKSLEDETVNREQYCFSTELSEDTCIMGLFMGYKGDNLRRFLLENFPKEARAVMKSSQGAEDVPLLLFKVFENMDKKVKLLLDKPMNNLENKLECATGVVIVIKNDLMFVANLGCNRALLVSDSLTLWPTITQLTQEHCLSNPEEVSRLSSLGMEVGKGQDLFGVPFTRCFGGTGLVQQFNCDKSAWTARPSVTGPFRLDDNVRMLVIVSRSVFEKWTGGGCGVAGGRGFNGELVSKVEHHLLMRRCMNDVAQSVLDEVSFFCSDSKAAQKINKFSQDLSHGRLLLLLHNFRSTCVEESFSPIGALSIDVECAERTLEESLLEQLRDQKAVSDNHLAKSTARAPDNNKERIKAYVDFTGFEEKVANLPDSLKKDFEVIMNFMNS